MGDETSRARRRANHAFHSWINSLACPLGSAGLNLDRSIYEWKDAIQEMRYLPTLFKRERDGLLPKLHRQCSYSQPEPIAENVLTCCKGVRVAQCEILVSLRASLSVDGVGLDEQDQVAASVCCWHIYSTGGDPAREGYVLTTDDRIFWDRTYRDMACGDYDDGEGEAS